MIRAVSVFFLVLGLAAAPVRAEDARVAIEVQAPQHAKDWQAALTAALGAKSGVRLVERTELSRILGERETAADAPPALEGVDVFLHFRNPEPGRWLIEKIDAGTGTATGSVSAEGAGVEAAPALADVAAKLLESKPETSSEAALRVAVMESGDQDPRAFILAARLRDALRGARLCVLDRALTQEVVSEKADAERGWRGEVSPSAFLGAEIFVEIEAHRDDCRFRVLRARDGKLLAGREFPYDGPGVVDRILPWLLSKLGRPAKVTQPYLPSVEIEALEPFYRGLALYDEGRFAEASAEFSRAYLRNDKFRDALLWEARCYDALGLAPVAAGVRRYADIGLVGNGSSGSARTNAAEAVAFLGIDGNEVLSALAASALCRTDREIRLPASLARLRREYDWLAGISQTEGFRWEQAPSFFCRLALRGTARQTETGITVAWAVRDTITGRTIASRSQALSADPKQWPSEIEKFAEELLAQEPTSSAPPGARADSESVSTLERRLRESRGLEANVALVKLAVANPAHPLLRTKGFERGASKRDGLDAHLNFGLRDYVLSRLPADDPNRRWLELARIFSFHETEPIGRLCTGQRVDFVRELEKFVEAAPQDAPSLVARYAVLYERQDELPPEELHEQCDTLLLDLEKAGAFSKRELLAEMTSRLRAIARMAAGRTEDVLPDLSDHKLHRVRVVWNGDGQPGLERHSSWCANEYAWIPLRPEEKIIEARAALAVNGRPSEHRKIQDRWLEEFPNSFVMAAFVADAIHEQNFWLGKPLVHPLNWDAERAAFLKMVRYAGDAFDHWLSRIDDANHLDRIENVIWGFFMALNERVYLGVFPEADYLALRDRLAKRMRETNQRVGRSGWEWKQAKLLAWQTLTPAEARELRRDRLNEIGREVYDRDVLRAELARVESRAAAGGSFDPKPWWKRLRGWDFDAAFTMPDLAEFYLRHTAEVERRFSKNPPSEEEQGFLYEHGLVLFYGGKMAEAERLFRLILDAPPRPETDAVQANAAFRLAQILRLAGRKSEAIAMARRGLEICGPTSWFVIGRLYDANMQREVEERGVTGGLAAHLTRLLAELRFDPARALLPDRAGVVSVPTPNADNPTLRVFYRQPPASAERTEKPRRALILIPSLNHDVLEYLEPGSAWARFADEHGLVLVCPRFYCSERADRAKHAFTYYLHPPVWSGKALLDALDRIGEKVPLRKDGLLFHSYGAGAGFACRFARWRPDLVSAVSLNGGGVVLPWFQEYPGLLPLTETKNVRFFITGGIDDDYAENTQNRFACAEALVTVLRGAGATVEWQSFPGVGHFPTPEMEAASRAFLEKQ
jgi:hypothetical protein